MLIIVIFAVLFCVGAILLSLGLQPQFMRRLTGILLMIVAISGTCIYGYAYLSLYDNLPQSIVRTLFSVLLIFFGKNEIKEISSVSPLGTPFMQVMIYLVHIAAMYCTASAVVQTIGTRFLRLLHLLFIRRGKLNLIYGVNPDTVNFARELLSHQAGTVVFVDSGKGASYDTAILRMGSILFSDSDAQKGSVSFLRRIGLQSGKRKIAVYCLDEDVEKNLKYAETLRSSLACIQVLPTQTSLTAILSSERSGKQLQHFVDQNNPNNSRYGFGSVHAFDTYDVLARLMIRTVPPYRTMQFDADGKTTEPFEALIVGFGKSGQSVLRALAMNGQFVGSVFRATVIVQGSNEQKGSFLSGYQGLMDFCNISFIEMDARSADCYKMLQEKGRTLKYVAVCTGNERINREIAQDYREFFRERGIDLAILQCANFRVHKDRDAYGPESDRRICSMEVLCGENLDSMAMIVNHQYHLNEGNTTETDWLNCDYFSRMSCRASADYSHAILAAAGTNKETVLTEGFSPDPALLETLSQMEHMRWCAFHYAMGYQKMPDTVWEERAKRYQSEKTVKGGSFLRIGKDPVSRLHACLIPWEDLDALSRREYDVTGIYKDYKQLDRDNVIMIPSMLHALRSNHND